MRFRQRLPWLLTLIPLLASWGLAGSAGPPMEPFEFTFIATADVHFGAFPECRTWLDQMLADVNAMTPPPALILTCGDLTEVGTLSELNGYQTSTQASKIPLYNSPGNHDVKWSSGGKARLREMFGPLYYSFDYGRFHFIALDVTVTLQQHAHVEKVQLDWLRQDLAGVGPERPVVLFMHHPLGRDKTYVDNQYEVLQALEGYNVVLLLQGHEHTEQQWNENGMTLVDVANLYGNRTQPGFYRILRVQEDAVTMLSKRSTQAQPLVRAVIDTRPQRNADRVRWLGPPEPVVPGDSTYRGLAKLASRYFTPDYIEQPITDDGVYWNGYYQFTVRMPSDADAYLKMRIRRNAPLVAVALEAQREDGTWGRVDWQAKPADDMLRPDDGRLWGDLVFHIPRGTPGPFRLISFVPDAPELNAYHLWLVTEKGEVRDTIDVGDAASEAAHQVSVTGRIRTLSATERYSTAVRYWLDLEYTNGRVAMTRRPDGLWEATFDTSRLRPGRHTLKVQAIDDRGAARTDYLSFDVERGPVRTQLTLPTEGGVQSAPTLDQDRLYVGANDGGVYAFDRRTGEPLWVYPTGDQVLASPTVAEGVIYVGSGDFNIYALDAARGTPLWTFETGGPIFGGAVLVDGVLYFGSGDHRLYAVEAASGRALWSFETGHLIQMKPAVQDGVVYFGAWDNYAYALRAADGQMLWRTRIGSSIYYSPAQMPPIVIGDSVLFSAPTGVHYLLDRDDGLQVGDPFPQPSAFGYNAGVLQDTTLYVVSYNGLAIGFDVSGSSPRELWRTTLGSQVVNSGLLLAEGILYVNGLRGLALAITADRGGPVFDYQAAAEGFIFSAPAFAEGQLYLGTLDGHVYAVGPTP